MFYEQFDFDVRCEWSAEGASRLSAHVDVVVVVDVLSFTTCMDIAVARGATVLPYRSQAEAAEAYAREKNAVLAAKRGQGFSLSPASLLNLPSGTRLLLNSLNGAQVTLTTGCRTTLAGCLRNAQAVAAACTKLGKTFLVVPAGERWEGGSLRPCAEDWIGAGAIIARLPGTKSPEAVLAENAFEAARAGLSEFLRQCSSGRELHEKGFGQDVELAAELDCSDAVPILRDGAYENWKT